jgi:hypothetical protein
MPLSAGSNTENPTEGAPGSLCSLGLSLTLNFDSNKPTAATHRPAECASAP